MLSFQLLTQPIKSNSRATLSLFVSLLITVGLVGCDDQMPTNQEDQSPPETLEQVANSHETEDVAVATADLHPINNSGVNGHITIEDDGESIVVTGDYAKGLDPTNFFPPENEGGDPIPGYISLFYDKASAPNGPEACEPGIFAHEAHSDEVRRVNPHPLGEDHPLFLTGPQMLGAYWTGYGPEAGNGMGTPVDFPSPPAEYVSVDEVGTISIRDLRINGGFGPEAVVACGKVTHKPEGPPMDN